MRKIQFSVIMPVKNSQETIKESLNSIFNQTHKNFEVIVVNDGSTDKSGEIIRDFNCKIVSFSESRGASSARNAGANIAKGEFLVFVDSDIILKCDVLKKAEEYIKKDKENAIFFGNFDEKIRFKNFASQYKHLYLNYIYLNRKENPLTLDTSLAFIKKKIFDRFKFNEKIKISEDTELAMRLVSAGYNIAQKRDIIMEHVKNYSLIKLLKSDFIRAKRFYRLKLKSAKIDKKKAGKETFPLKPLSMLSPMVAPFIWVYLLIFLLTRNIFFLLFFLTFCFVFTAINLDFWSYIIERKGIYFSLKSSLFTLADSTAMSLGAAITLAAFLVKGREMLK